VSSIPHTQTLEEANARLDDVATYAQALRRKAGPLRDRRLMAQIADELDEIVLLPRVVYPTKEA
jgi:hypothetical protein